MPRLPVMANGPGVCTGRAAQDLHVGRSALPTRGTDIPACLSSHTPLAPPPSGLLWPSFFQQIKFLIAAYAVLDQAIVPAESPPGF